VGPVANPVTRPKIDLYGVVIGEGYVTASVINPGRALHKGERETRTIKVGDMIAGYKVIKIALDRIVVAAGEDFFEVLLYDPKAPKKRVETRTPNQAATITTILPTPTPPEITQPEKTGVTSSIVNSAPRNICNADTRLQTSDTRLSPQDLNHRRDLFATFIIPISPVSFYLRVLWPFPPLSMRSDVYSLTV
jgi:hypothetical protein